MSSAPSFPMPASTSSLRMLPTSVNCLVLIDFQECVGFSPSGSQQESNEYFWSPPPDFDSPDKLHRYQASIPFLYLGNRYAATGVRCFGVPFSRHPHGSYVAFDIASSYPLSPVSHSRKDAGPPRQVNTCRQFGAWYALAELVIRVEINFMERLMQMGKIAGSWD